MDDDALSYLLELRLRVRGRPEALRIVDRCLSLVGRANSADAVELATLEHEVRRLADELALRFGAPAGAILQ
jgi:hypothetical protein